MRARVQRVFANVPEDIDLVVLQNNVSPHVDMSFFHASDLVKGGGFERSVAVMHRDGSLDLLVPALEETSARRAPDASITTFKTQAERVEWLGERLKGAGRVGFNPSELVTSDYLAFKKNFEDIAFHDVSDALAKARAVKDATELARMKRAADIVSEVADGIPSLLRDGLKEFELAAEIGYAMQKRGATGPSFDTIVGFGEGSAEPHYHPHDVALTKRQFVLCDFGAYVERYASDLTRTWCYGKPSDDHRSIYETVHAALDAALGTIRAGVKGGDVHTAAASLIDATKWKGRFIHSVGHSLGLAVHDGPALHPRHDWTLEEGMVITVEPGIYVPGLGGVRIEDDVVVTKDGYRMLTSARKDAWVVD